MMTLTSRACPCRQIHAHKQATEKERQAEMELLAADPFDMEAQAKIAERIRQAQVTAMSFVWWIYCGSMLIRIASH